MPTPLPLPSTARLLHVGPHKTGTTALQSALHQSRADLTAQGVEYVSAGQHDARAARWATQRLVAGTEAGRAEQRWRDVVGRLRGPGQSRKVFSSEFLSDATDEQIASIAAEVGIEDLWVAITLRPLAKILPSQYQQAMQRQGGRLYDGFLRTVLDDQPGSGSAQDFWRRHRHDELAQRWAAQVGAERVIVVVLDPGNPSFLPHAFEQILGLSPETLARHGVAENRSLTAAEVELLRLFNSHYQQLGLGPDLYARLLRSFKRHLKSRPPKTDETRLVTPDWAVDRANRIGAEMADGIRALGATVLGDLTQISDTPLSGVRETPAPPTTVDIDLAGWFAAGLAQAASQRPTTRRTPVQGPSKPASTRRRLLDRFRDSHR